MNKVKVDIQGNTITFPDKAGRLPVAERDTAGDRTSVTLDYEFTGTTSGFSKVSFGDFKIYQVSLGTDWPQVTSARTASGRSSEAEMAGNELARLSASTPITKQVQIVGLPKPPNLLLLDSTVTVETSKEGQVSVIDPPPVIIYP